MDVSSGKISGVKLIRLDMRRDARGFFVERYHAPRFAEAGLPAFKQDNHSRSAPGVLRGLHYQYGPPQGKLVGVIRGRVWDVAVDIRSDSPTYGQYEAVELSDENGFLLWIPPGFAHGFCVLGDAPADMLYKVTEVYHPAGEGGIRYDDPELAVAWPLKNPNVSDRDRALPSWKEYRANPPAWRAA